MNAHVSVLDQTRTHFFGFNMRHNFFSHAAAVLFFFVIVSCAPGTEPDSCRVTTSIIAKSDLPPRILADTTRTFAYFGAQPANPDSLLQVLCAAGIRVNEAWLPLDNLCLDPIGPRFTVELSGADDRIKTHGFRNGYGNRLICATQLKRFVVSNSK
jgi:hypothetical protein